jgi:hypothetical protein
MTYLKAIAAALVAGAASIATALDDNHISNVEWLAAVVAVCASTGVVWYVTNGPGGEYAKEIFSAISVAASSLIISLQDNVLTSQEVLTAVIAVAAGFGLVAAMPGPKSNLPPRSGQ